MATHETAHGRWAVVAGLLCCSLLNICAKAEEERAERTARDAGLKGAEIPEDWKKTVAGDRPFLVYVTAPIRDSHPAPNEVPGLAPSNTVSLTACPGEYEPASFSVFAVEDLENVKPAVSDLSGDAGTIPSGAIDVRVVKWWYQNGRAGGNVPLVSGPVLLPELLLHDDRVVVTSGGTNHFKDWQDPRDTKDLQPVDIPEGILKQFWLTVHVPKDAKAGHYTGTVKVIPQNRPAQDVQLNLEVFPFQLAGPCLDYSFYYITNLRHGWGFGMGHYPEEKQDWTHRDEEMLEYELRHLVAHGVDNPCSYQVVLDRDDEEEPLGKFDLSGLEKYLQLRRKVGTVGKPFLLCRGVISGDSHRYCKDATTFPEQTRRIKEVVRLVKKYGNTDLYLYGIDEDDPSLYVPWLRMVHEAGAKIWVAGPSTPALRATEGLMDLAVSRYTRGDDAIEVVHGYGGRVYCYARPQGGVEQAFTYRHNYGLRVWTDGYDGVCTWAWYWSYSRHIWDEFHKPPPDARYRHHNMVYPTKDGIVDTIQSEGFREAVDDVRYLSTLLEAAQAATTSKDDAVKVAGAKELKWLHNLPHGYSPSELERTRHTMAGKIIQLKRLMEDTVRE